MTCRPFFAFLLLYCAALTGWTDEVNLALGKPVTASGAAIGGYPLTNITDGDSATFTHPAATPAIGFYFQIDLGQEYSLQALHLYSRVDCCADRLSRVRMTVHADAGGVAGVANWSYDIRPNGETNPQGGADVLTGNLGAGQFRGRFIRITNYNNSTFAPQVAEIEAYEAPKPTVRYFSPDAGNITKIGAPGKPAQANLFWKIDGATAVSIDQGVGTVSPTMGSVAVSPAVTTTYTLTATNGAGIITKTVTIGVDAVEVPPTLSEFVASNVGGLRDNFGKRSDWIEIANPNPFTINLQNYFLTDNPADKTKWRFPAFTVPGNGYALVYADGTSVAGDPYEPPHANFSLAAGGEYLALYAPNGVTLLSQFPATYPTPETFPAQVSDFSYGISGGVDGFFAVPTPAAANGTRYDGVVANPVMSIPRGFYSTQQSVAITCATAEATIRYTLDGSVPTLSNGTNYTAPLNISATTVLQAAAFRTGYVPARTITHTYIFPASVIATTPWAASGQLGNLATMTEALQQVPSMSLTVGPGVAINGADDKVGMLEWIDPASSTSTFQIPCGVKNFGGAFTNFAKKSYRISFKGEYGASKLEFPLFTGFERGLAPVEEFDQLELRNGSHDMAERGFYMSNIFTDATMLDMGAFAPHGRFVHLYINGVYWGLFHLRERWGADMMSAYYGGSDDDYESINGNLNVGGWADPGTPYDGTGEYWEAMKALARSGPDTFAKLSPQLDTQQYIDYMIMFMFGDSEDEYRTTGPKGPGHGFKFLLNDADGYLRTSAGNRTGRGTPGKQNGDGPGSLFSMLLRDGGPEYKILLADRIQRAYVSEGGALTPAKNAARLTELCNAINKAILPECARWNYRTPATWASSRDTILNSWFPNRTSTVLGYYKTAGMFPSTDSPLYTLPGGVVASGSSLGMSGPTSGSTIYYTVNGGDPRLATTATVFNAPLVTSTTTARYRVPTSQSDGITVASIPNLVAYYPLDANAGDTVGGFNGTLSNGATIVGPGKFGGGAVELNGTTQSVTLGDPAGLKILGQITVSAWVKPDAVNGLRNVVSKGYDSASSPNGEVALRIIDGSYQGGYWAGTAGTVYAIGPTTGTNSATADIGIWTHLAMVFDGSFWRVYRNGVEITSSPSTVGSVTVPAMGWAIGARGNGAERFFDGQIDEVRFYNRGLSASEIVALYNNTGTVPSAVWAQPATSVSTWATGSGAFGFAPVGDELLPGITQNIGGAMQGINSSLYTRWNFTLTPTQRTSTQLLQLKVRADDGYAVYLNGTKVASRNAPASLLGDSAATAETPDATALAGDTIDLTSSIPLLLNGGNVLAIQGLNLSAGDPDFLLGAEMTSYRGVAGLSPSAQTYSTPISITQNTIIRSRAYVAATGTWSGLQETFYQVGPSACPPGALVVSELHYNPVGDDDGEFVELMNVSTGAINLRGVKFTRGITFSFPENRDVLMAPGERLVLVDSELTFQQIQGLNQRVGGIYSGSFDNNGGRVTIVAADGVTSLVDFTYLDTAPWPVEADGQSGSLVLIRPTFGIDLTNPANWRLSSGLNGNPNGGDGVVFSGSPNLDLDGDGYTSFLEYALGTSDNVNALGSLPSVLTPTPGVPGAYDFTFRRAVAADDAAWQIEVATELSDWQVVTPALVQSTVSNGIIYSTYRLQGLPGEGAMFARVRFIQR